MIYICMFIYLFGVLSRFQHCTGHVTTGSWNGRGNQYIQFVRVLYCKLLTNDKQLPAFPLEVVPGTEPRSQRWEARVLPLCHRGSYIYICMVHSFRDISEKLKVIATNYPWYIGAVAYPKIYPTPYMPVYGVYGG